jgi:hypothetical protein
MRWARLTGAGEAREQRPQQLLDDRLLALPAPGPCRLAGDRPAEVLRHRVDEGPAVALRQGVEHLLHHLLVAHAVAHRDLPVEEGTAAGSSSDRCPLERHWA